MKILEEEKWINSSNDSLVNSLFDCALYYEVPDQILSWMYYDKANFTVRTFTRSDLLLKSGHENPTPRLEASKSKTRFSRISQELNMSK